MQNSCRSRKVGNGPCWRCFEIDGAPVVRPLVYAGYPVISPRSGYAASPFGNLVIAPQQHVSLRVRQLLSQRVHCESWDSEALWREAQHHEQPTALA